MRSRKFLLGLGVLAVPALFTAGTAALGHPWLPAVGMAASLLLIGAIALDTNKRARARYGQRPMAAPAKTAPATTEEDLMGTIRLLQAQYVGRLDRAQDSLELATAALLTAAEERDRAGAPQQ